MSSFDLSGVAIVPEDVAAKNDVDTADDGASEHVEQGGKTSVVCRSMKLFIHYARG